MSDILHKNTTITNTTASFHLQLTPSKLSNDDSLKLTPSH